VNIYYIFTLDEPHHENAAVYPNASSGNCKDSDSGKTPDNDDGLNKGLFDCWILSVLRGVTEVSVITTRNKILNNL
jgi:hypothetical protein